MVSLVDLAHQNWLTGCRSFPNRCRTRCLRLEAQTQWGSTGGHGKTPQAGRVHVISFPTVYQIVTPGFGRLGVGIPTGEPR